MILLLWILAAAGAPVLARRSYRSQDLAHRLEGPSRGHPLGTDELGRDVLARALFGARVSLAVTAAALLLSLLAGVLLGTAAGLLGGPFDLVLGRLMDTLLALPGILVAIAVLAFSGRGFVPLVAALSATAWVGYARVARALARRTAAEDYVAAARAAGAGALHTLFRHILPAALPVLSVQAAAGAASVMVAEAGLSFLGLGVPPPFPSWGEMLASGCDTLLEAPHLAAVPGVLLFSAVWALNTLGEGLARALGPGRNPRVDTV
ncbi:MAG: ABC transporter permease [Acidobacteriota bacterium]